MNATVEKLATSTGFPRISIYFPTHPTFPDWEQDPIRLSNCLKRATSQLEEAGLTSSAIDALLAEARDRTKEAPYWRYQDKGLAVLIAEGETHWVKLPAAPPELTIIANKFHVRPLIHLLRDRGGVSLLTVSRDGAHFYNASADGLEEIQLEELPDGVDEIRGRTDFDANLGFHSRSRGSEGGGSAPKYAALGESPDDYDETILEAYTRGVAKAVDTHLAASNAPLVVMALPRTLGRLKQVLDNRHTLIDPEAKDPQSLDKKTLLQRALEIAEPTLTQERDALRDQLRAATSGSGERYLKSVEDILRAAEEGRVETVFLDRRQTVWGHYDPDHRVARIDRESGPQNEDLMNLAALKTLATGGDARSMPDDLNGDIGPIAALLRY
jgi:hypothetical protein